MRHPFDQSALGRAGLGLWLVAIVVAHYAYQAFNLLSRGR